MQVPAASTRGRKPIPQELWDKAVAMFHQGATPAEVMWETSLGQTKVYEIRRVALKSAPQEGKAA